MYRRVVKWGNVNLGEIFSFLDSLSLVSKINSSLYGRVIKSANESLDDTFSFWDSLSSSNTYTSFYRRVMNCANLN